MIKILKKSNWLVTGGAGFIGANLINHLIKNNQKVICVDSFINGSIKNIKDFKKNKNFKLLKKDIRKLNKNDFKEKVDYVIHLAALGSVERSFKNPLETNSVNVDGSINIMILASKLKAKKFIFASSSSVYGDLKKEYKTETDETNPISPYGVSKLSFEKYSITLSKKIKLQTIGLRFFNVFGPRQKTDGPYAAVIALWCENILNNKMIFINGDGNTSRDFTYIDNVIDGILRCCLKKINNYHEILNLACGNEIKLKDLLKNILKFTKISQKKIKVKIKGFRKGDIKRSKANINKAKKILQYKPKINFIKGIERYINFLISN